MSVDRYMAINLALNERARKCRTRIAAVVISVCVWSITLLSVINILMYADVRECQCALFFPGMNLNACIKILFMIHDFSLYFNLVGSRETQLNFSQDLYYDYR